MLFQHKNKSIYTPFAIYNWCNLQYLKLFNIIVFIGVEFNPKFKFVTKIKTEIGQQSKIRIADH